EARGQVEARKREARSAFDAWLAEATPSHAAQLASTDGLTLHAPLDEGAGATLHATVSGSVEEIALAAEPEWESGVGGEKALKIGPNDVVEFASAGDFDTRQGFSYGAWVK